ncbi:MAG TPA: TAXI family TRAP transporter solute-binding subunit [Steroidobacteraceae bacterium]|jgi:TRAP-type uncharacterized transport system substrate-binding protein|nr:TAXI family TRAP transporter solute-binding subunit [Steroidobacteraceae bacterium]
MTTHRQSNPGESTERQRLSLRNLSHRAMRISWWDLTQTLGPILLLGVLGVLLALHFGGPAPPHSISIASGPEGSNFATMAARYQKVLKRNGIELKVIDTEGSLDNLKRMADPKSRTDIALVQSGLAEGGDNSDLDSLGSVFYQALTIFYRSPKPLMRLSELRGGRIAIGPEGSGTRALALALLKANEIEPGGSTLLTSDEGEGAREALLKREVDAIFLTGDSASGTTIREMLHTEGVRLFDFEQADAYTRRFPYLNKLVVPAGAFDLGEDLPASDVNLLAPTVELVAHPNLHPALVDLLIEASEEVNGRASLMQSAGQFPTPALHTYPISDEAMRYYKSGNKSFAYRYLPFWLASLFNRLIVVLVPLFVVVVPGLRFLPALYRWRIATRIHRRYGELMAVEREALGPLSPERRLTLLERLEEIERSVISHRMPGSHAEQVYVLREHIRFVRDNLARPIVTPLEPVAGG